MEQTEQFVDMMLRSLQKKNQVLDAIIQQNDMQSRIVNQEELNLDSFGVSVEEKQKLIDELNKLDDGFQMIFDKLKEELSKDRALYADQIKQMQELIKIITDKSVKIQAQEEKNKECIMAHFAKMRKEVKVAKTSMDVAANYYKNMSKTAVVDSQFMDKKK